MNEQQKFTAQLGSLNKDIKYCAGGGGSMFDPGEIAEDILPSLRGGPLFAYLFRRFGYPNTGWDEYKNLVSYRITTPVRDVFLTITPYMGADTPTRQKTTVNATSLMFGYYVPKTYEDEFYDCLTTRGHAGWKHHARYKETNNAFKVAIQELLRPVFIRDIAIHCYGTVNEEEDAEMVEEVEHFHAAGYGISSELFQSGEQWESFTDALILLGEGDIVEGMKQVIISAENEEKKKEKGKGDKEIMKLYDHV